jgi:hypothetical protein
MLSTTVLMIMYPLVVLATHRIWNRERIGWIVRTTCARVPGLNCEHCNIFWIGLLWAVFLLHGYNETTALVANPVMLSLSVYAPVRAATWFYDVDSRVSAWSMRRQSPGRMTEEPQKKPCKTCGDKSNIGDQIRAHHDKAQSFKHRVVFVIGGEKPPLRFRLALDALNRSKNWYIEVWGTDTTYLKSLDVTTFSYPSGMPDNEFKQGLVKQLIRLGNGLVISTLSAGEVEEAISGLRGFAAVEFDLIHRDESWSDKGFVEHLTHHWNRLLVNKTA